MALIKMVRDLPEVPGGKTTADIPEESVEMAKREGWKEASKKPETKTEEPKVEAPKATVEVKKEEKTAKAGKNKTDKF